MEALANELSLRVTLFIVASPFVALGLISSCYAIAAHLIHYTIPKIQRYEVRVLLMIPVYIVLTWLPLYYPRATRYYRMGRDFFQGFFLASFFQLLIEYLGGEDQTVILMGKKPPRENGNCCFCGPKKKPTTFDQPVSLYLKLKRGTMQFTIVTPTIAVIVMLLDFYNLYDSGEFDPAKSYVWLQLIKVISALWSMGSLKEFLAIMEPELSAQNVQATQKMLCIQGVILGLLLQGIFISILFASFGWGTPEYNSEDINNFIAVCEMTFVSFAHSVYFGHPTSNSRDSSPESKSSPSESRSGQLTLTRAATDSLIPTDYIEDLKTVFSKKTASKLDRNVKSYGTLPIEEQRNESHEIPQPTTEDEDASLIVNVDSEIQRRRFAD